MKKSESRLYQAMAFEERRILLAELGVSGWNRRAAARRLGISYRSIMYKIKEYGLKPPQELAVK